MTHASRPVRPRRCCASLLLFAAQSPRRAVRAATAARSRRDRQRAHAGDRRRLRGARRGRQRVRCRGRGGGRAVGGRAAEFRHRRRRLVPAARARTARSIHRCARNRAGGGRSQGLPRRERPARIAITALERPAVGRRFRASPPALVLDRRSIRQAAAVEIAGAGDPHRARGLQARSARPRRGSPRASDSDRSAMPASAALYLADGEPPKAGWTFKHARPRAHARSDRRTRQRRFLSRRDRARDSSTACARRAATGRSTISTSYKVKEREPIAFEYRGWHIVTAPPPSSGGIALAEMLQHPVAATIWRSSTARIACTHRRGDAPRVSAIAPIYLGDPDFVQDADGAS